MNLRFLNQLHPVCSSRDLWHTTLCMLYHTDWCNVVPSHIQRYFEDSKQHTQLHNSRLLEMVQFQFHDWNNDKDHFLCPPTSQNHVFQHFSANMRGISHTSLIPLLAPGSPPLVNKWAEICSLLWKDGGFLPSQFFGQFFIHALCISKQWLIPPGNVSPPSWTPFCSCSFSFIQHPPPLTGLSTSSSLLTCKNIISLF